jgi:hypothetical protein
VNESVQLVVAIPAQGQVMFEAQLYLPHFLVRHQAINVLIEATEYLFTREFVIAGFTQEAHQSLNCLIIQWHVDARFGRHGF